VFVRKENKLDLNPYLKPGINLIRVVVDDNLETHTFKYLK
jgi:hypothetical protein